MKKKNGFVKRMIFLVYLCLAAANYSAGMEIPSFDSGGSQRFRLSYFFQMDLKGYIMLLVPYRSYFEASASIELEAEYNPDKHIKFRFSGIDQPGYLLSTGGLTATSLYFFTADSSAERRERFYQQKLKRFRYDYPGDFSRFKKIRNRPISVLSTASADFSFERSPVGIHNNIHEGIKLSDSHSQTYANIYAIMGVLVKAFSHRILPQKLMSLDDLTKNQIWKSSPLDYSGLLAETTRLTSQYAERRIKPQQKNPFSLNYRISQFSDSRLTISGQSHRKLLLWKGMVLHRVQREIIIDRKLMELVRDEVQFHMGGDFSKKGKVVIRLERKDG